MDEDTNRDWIDLVGLTIERLSYGGDYMRLHFSDESFIDVGVDDAFDEAGMRLLVSDDIEQTA